MVDALPGKSARRPDQVCLRNKPIMSRPASPASPSGATLSYEDITRNGPDAGSWRNVDIFLDAVAVIRRNAFSGFDEVEGEPYDDDAATLLLEAAHRTGLRVTRERLDQAVKARALRNQYHPIRQYLEKLEWDGEARIDTWLTDYLGAEDNAYVRAIGAKTLIAAVQRVLKPGTKFDTMLVLEGRQGVYKSTAIKLLAIKDDWFTDGVAMNLPTKTFMEQTAGKWIVEVPELAGMSRGAVEHIKAGLSRTHDRSRLAWGRLATTAARQFIMVGTVNTDKQGGAYYLKDPTGNRRFWPVRVGMADVDALRRDTRQLWAEAYARRSESNVLDQELWALAEREQEQRREIDPIEEQVTIHFADHEEISVSELTEVLGVPSLSRMPKDQFAVLVRSLVGLGFEPKAKQVKRGGMRPCVYLKAKKG
jgi:predicted P-loop ATPase